MKDRPDLLVCEDSVAGEIEVKTFDFDQVRAAILGVNGVTRTLVTIYRGNAHLAVGGQADGWLVVYATPDNESFVQLSRGSTEEPAEVQIIAGGQPGLFPSHLVVDVEIVLIAARCFHEMGSLAEGLHWVTQ